MRHRETKDRKQDARDLMRFILSGPSQIKSSVAAEERGAQAQCHLTSLWLRTWIEPLVRVLIPECRELPATLAALHQPPSPSSQETKEECATVPKQRRDSAHDLDQILEHDLKPGDDPQAA